MHNRRLCWFELWPIAPIHPSPTMHNRRLCWFELWPIAPIHPSPTTHNRRHEIDESMNQDDRTKYTLPMSFLNVIYTNPVLEWRREQ
jgi:hypothetical protein